MTVEINGLYEFGDYRLDAAERLLLCGDRPIPLTPKAFETLLVLVRHSGHLVSKDHLMKEVWSDAFVEEINVARNVWILRKALADDEREHRYIETVPKLGYRFIAPVRPVNGSREDAGTKPTTVAGDVAKVDYADTIADDNAWAAGDGSSRNKALAGYRGWAIVISVTLMSAALVYGLYFRRPANAREPEIKQLAVLPIKSLTKEKDDSYLRLGLTDTIITRVSQIDGLFVRQLSSVRKYNDLEINSLDAATQLGVDAVLESTMQGTSDRVRINFNLLRTRDGASLWSYTSDDLNPTDNFRMQDIVAQQVAARLKLKLRPQTASPAHSNNQVAYTYYLQAKYHGGLQNRSENDEAIDLLEHAIAADPNFAAAYAALAQEYRNKGFALRPQEKEWEEKASVAVDKALDLDPELAEAHVARAMLLWTRSNQFPHQRAIEEFRRALDLNPNLDEAHHQLGHVYNHIGLLEKGQEEIQKAVAINPANTAARFRLGVNLLYQSKYEQALAAFGDSQKFDPTLWGYQTAWALFQLGRREEARATIAEALKSDPQDEGGSLTSIEAMLAAAAGDNRQAEEKIRKAIEIGKDYQHFHHTAYAIASAYALMNKPEQALEWLQRTAEDGFPCYPLFERDPNLTNLRQDKRFVAFMARLKEQWERYMATL